MTQNAPLPLSNLIDFLFKICMKPDGGRYTSKDLADSIEMSETHVSLLRNGKSNNPGYQTLIAICDYFNVPFMYFGARSYDEAQTIVKNMNLDFPFNGDNEEAMTIALRAMQLSDDGKKELLKVLTWIQTVEVARLQGIDINNDEGSHT